MTKVLRFPDRKPQVEAERRHERNRRSIRSLGLSAVSIAKSGLTFCLMPYLLWLSVLDRIEREERADDE